MASMQFGLQSQVSFPTTSSISVTCQGPTGIDLDSSNATIDRYSWRRPKPAREAHFGLQLCYNDAMCRRSLADILQDQQRCVRLLEHARTALDMSPSSQVALKDQRDGVKLEGRFAHSGKEYLCSAGSTSLRYKPVLLCLNRASEQAAQLIAAQLIAAPLALPPHLPAPLCFL